MSTLDASLVEDAIPGFRCELGEGPVWHSATATLIFVDIRAGTVHRFSPRLATDAMWTREMGGEVGAAIPTVAGGMVVANDLSLRLLDADGTEQNVWSVGEDAQLNRFNDCRTDRSGRLWAGTMSRRRVPQQAALYRLDPDGSLVVALAPTTLSNGIGWSPDSRVMYFIDSTTQRIDRFDFHLESGGMENRRPFAQIQPADGLPDGLTVDADGGVWVCLFGGSAIRRYRPDGSLERVISLPVEHPTCPVFGGKSLDTLYITTSRHLLDAEARAASPLAGAVLRLNAGVTGLASVPYGGGRPV